MKKDCRVPASLFLVLLLLNVIPIFTLVGSPHNWNAVSTRVEEPHRIIANTPYAPIVINGDSDFAATASTEGWVGDGSQQNPYVIENYDITSSFDPESSINITDTRAYYIIRGCRLTGPAATPSYGIYLENSTNGQIINNMATNFAQGLNATAGCSNLFVSGNNMSYNSYGIDIHYSIDCIVIDNYCNGNFFHGISLDTCENSSVIDNTCNENTMSGIYIYNCDSITVSSNTCNDNDFGIHLEEQGHHTVTENFCANNSDSGIDLFNCKSNTIANNTSIDNALFGVTLHNLSNHNSVLWNALINNGWGNAYDDGAGTAFHYNYYSDYVGIDANQDYIGDTSHSFNYNIDFTPLMYVPFVPEWVVIPEDQTIEFGNDFEYTFQYFTVEPVAFYELHVNDSMNFAVINNEMIQSRTILPVGDYPLDVNTTNVYNYYTKTIFTLAVRDTTPPTITHPDDISVSVGDEGPQLEWTLSDLSPLNYFLLRNGTEISSSDEPRTAVYFLITLETYSTGVFNYTMIGVDIWGNVATDMVFVTILPIPFMDAMLPWFILGVASIVVVIVIVVVIKKQRK
jgi:parallel beta-helix repeat protein